MTDHAAAIPAEDFDLAACTTTQLPGGVPKLGVANADHAKHIKLNLADYVAADAPAVPKAVHRSHLEFSWGMLKNDTLGDCGPAMLLHAIEAFHLDAGTPVPHVTDADAIRAYEQIGGYVQGNESTDRGVDNHVLVQNWEHPGISVSADRSAASALNAAADQAAAPKHTIAGSLFVDTKDHELAKRAIWEFVVLFRAVGLPVTAQRQKKWDVVEGAGEDGDVGSWGYHDIPLVSYDEKLVRLITWGTPLLASWAFDAKYAVEGFVVVTQEQLNASGVSPAGFDWTAISRDFKALGA
jgi:hypothetical protein